MNNVIREQDLFDLRLVPQVAETTGHKVVIKHATIVATPDGKTAIVTRCTRCGKDFPVAFRQERTRDGQPYRSIPQCSPCRGRYAKFKRWDAEADAADIAGELFL